MRMFKILLALVCSLQFAVQAAQQTDPVEINSLDYASMLQISSAILSNHFGPRLEAIMEQTGETHLTPANKDEEVALNFAFTYFLIAVARMQQEAACLLEQKEANEMLNTIWAQGSAIFGLMPEELQRSAIIMAIEWLEQHGDDVWAPADHEELYKTELEWYVVRSQAVQQYCVFLGQALQEA